MLRTRLILAGTCLLAIFLLFLLPKAVVESDRKITEAAGDSIASHIQTHAPVPAELRALISHYRRLFSDTPAKEKNAIFADSLASLYRLASQYDSAAWFAEEASKFFNNPESWLKAGDNYYQAYTLAVDAGRQEALAAKAQAFYGKVLQADPGNLDAKTNLAMTYITSASPMQGIAMLQEVLKTNPRHEGALFSMGMLSIQSRQYEKAIERLTDLVAINPEHLQAQLLLAIAWMENGDREKARTQFEKVKQMDDDPAVHATVDSYLDDLK